MSQVLPLQLLSTGESGHVLDVAGSERLVSRLAEMGFHKGARIRMVQPGEPCIVALDHQRLSFRGEENATVLVEVSSDEVF